MLTRPRAAAPSAQTVDLLRLRVSAGLAPVGLESLPRRVIRAVAVASAVGAPILDAIDGARAAQDDADQARRAVQVASAQTRAVAAGLLVAPVLLVPGLGRLVGADLVGFYRSGVGLLVLAVGISLLGTGAGLVALLVRRVGRASAVQRSGRTAPVLTAIVAGIVTWRTAGPALAPLAALLVHHLVARRSTGPAPVSGIDEAADLVATALTGGVSVPAALRWAARELPTLRRPLHRLAFALELGLGPDPARQRPSVRDPDPALDRLAAVLATATEVGAPVAPTLRRLARDLRADDLARVLAAAERLPAQLTFPTALCLLPATVRLIGAPIVHAGLIAAGT